MSPTSYNRLWKHSPLISGTANTSSSSLSPSHHCLRMLSWLLLMSHYTNIPHEEGIESVLHYMKLHADILPPGAVSPHRIGILLETILKNNNLSLVDKHFLELVGTAMGTKAAPPYANLFICRQEETIRETFIWAIPFCKRFIDDIFLVSLGTTNQLQSLQGFMNQLNLIIKFTFQYSTQHISFLDKKIQIGANCKLFTTLYRNPMTARHFYIFTPTTHSNAKKGLFFHRLSDTTSSLQMITYYKKNSIPSQYLSFP